ncbi:MAG TPA: hypothetical protein VE863_16665 [Pyrinomonadaceae bacterium]|jgi:hypothetical protein|nr:hypothetical protein [Pyrinomonadaceae bacterium]
MEDRQANEGLTKAQIAQLGDLRSRLLHLHKSLLEMERQNFEKKSGRVTTGELLQLVINHSQFAWLRIISALLVEIDEVLNGEEPAASEVFEDLLSHAHLLFTSPANEEFKTNYKAALQREPSVVMAHAAVMEVLRKDN